MTPTHARYAVSIFALLSAGVVGNVMFLQGGAGNQGGSNSATGEAAHATNATAGAASQSVLPPVGIAAAPIEDYTAVFAGATWNRGPWGANLRTEYRHGTLASKVNLAASVHRPPACPVLYFSGTILTSP